ncbi:glyQS [Symbiodinium necroappetens]|uniref:GlyQS protein n=1 Tax=Symbiodinium necroappetens TaxID=1628268 RepID=A0A812QTN8_9DINO|nr:glyQS [Symbiodinium necroappetens]
MSWESCKSYVSKEADIKAEAKLLGVTRPIAHTDRTAMKAAFEKTHYRLEEHLEPSEAYLSAKVEEVEASEITASPLSDVTSRKTSRDSGIQTTVDQNGHVRVVKSKVKGQLPQNTEELRLALKAEGHMWTMLASKFRNISLFRGMGPGVWSDFADYLMGEKVYLMKIPNQYGDNTGVRPPWHVLLQYEFQVRKESIKTSVRENRPLAEVLPEKSRDSEIREQHFISPITLQGVINEGRGNRLRWGQQQQQPPRWQPYQAWSRNTDKGDKGKGKLIDMKGDYKGGKTKTGKGKDKGKRVLTHTPDGRQICYAFNEGTRVRAAAPHVAALAEEGCFIYLRESHATGTLSHILRISMEFKSEPDLGRTRDGQHPASVWQLPELQELVKVSKGVTWALHQCHYGADTPKPTRLATNLPEPSTHESEWPVFDEEGWYVGPLGSCGHHHDRQLQGLEGDQWRTGPSAAYPSAFCFYMAQLCMGARVCAPTLADTADVGHVAHEAERFAAEELATGRPVARTTISTLFSLLPGEPPHKASGSLEGRVFISGIYSKGGLVGLRQNCHLFPFSTQLCNKFIREQAPDHKFSSFILLHNVKADVHKDLGNADTPSLLIGVSSFTNGELWVESPDGNTKMNFKDKIVFGNLHPVCDTKVFFDARNTWHATMPWQGDRLVVAAYNPAFMRNLQPQQLQQLRDLGFPLSLDASAASASSPLPDGLGGSGGVSADQGDQEAGADEAAADESMVVVLGSSKEDAGEEKGEQFDPRYSRALGQPMQCHHEGYTQEFVDGFGLCSPGRWPPEARGHLQTLEERKHVNAIASVLEDLVNDAIGDVKHKSMELALGRLKGSPFSEEQLWRARGRICDVLPAPEAAREIPERQPFMLHMLGQSLKLLGDPDWEVLCQGPESFAEGVPLGCDGELKRTPQVFRARVKSRKLDETDFQPIMQNYSSAEMTQAQLEEKFKQDEALGRMIATTEAAARQEYQEVLVAALGAISKPNGEVRPLHDATHGVRINNRISVPDRLETPGPEEIVELITRAKATKQAAFCISADISAAHRCVKIRKSDWGRLGCKTCSSSQTLWINTVGTFGVSSASYHWSRLFGAIGRWALRILGQKWALQIIYVDDLHVVVVGPDRFKTLWLLLAAYEVAGTPFNHAKFKGGHEAEFVGYFLSYYDSRAGISERRCRWVLDWIAAVERDRWMILGRSLAEFVGRLTFVGRMVGWVRPFLAPLYAWKAFLNRGTTARAPEAVYLSLCYLRDHFEDRC